MLGGTDWPDGRFGSGLVWHAPDSPFTGQQPPSGSRSVLRSSHQPAGPFRLGARWSSSKLPCPEPLPSLSFTPLDLNAFLSVPRLAPSPSRLVLCPLVQFLSGVDLPVYIPPAVLRLLFLLLLFFGVPSFSPPPPLLSAQCCWSRFPPSQPPVPAPRSSPWPSPSSPWPGPPPRSRPARPPCSGLTTLPSCCPTSLPPT